MKLKSVVVPVAVAAGLMSSAFIAGPAQAETRYDRFYRIESDCRHDSAAHKADGWRILEDCEVYGDRAGSSLRLVAVK